MIFPRISFDLAGHPVFPEPFVFFLATGVVAWLVRRSLTRENVAVDRSAFFALALYSITSMLIGTRLWYFFFFSRTSDPRLVDPVGLASLGLYLGLIVGVLLWGTFWLRRRREDHRALTRTVLGHICCYLPLGTVIGRMGCFLAAHKVGKPTDLPFGLIRGDSPPWNVARHPLDLYQVLVALGLFLLLHAIRARQGSVKNVEFWYVVLFATSHFLLDFVSAEALVRPVLDLTVDQIACLGIVAFRVLLRYQGVRASEPRTAG